MKEWKNQMEMEMDRQKRKAVITSRGDEITGGKREPGPKSGAFQKEV